MSKNFFLHDSHFHTFVSYHTGLKQTPGTLKTNRNQLWPSQVENDNGKFTDVKDQAGNQTQKISKTQRGLAAQSLTEVTPQEQSFKDAVADASTACTVECLLDTWCFHYETLKIQDHRPELLIDQGCII